MAAAELLRQGKSLSEVARKVEASPSSVHRWKQVLAQPGLRGLSGRRHPGPRRRLSLS